jgi:hypothetical protein
MAALDKSRTRVRILAYRLNFENFHRALKEFGGGGNT